MNSWVVDLKRDGQIVTCCELFYSICDRFELCCLHSFALYNGLKEVIFKFWQLV